MRVACVVVCGSIIFLRKHLLIFREKKPPLFNVCVCMEHDIINVSYNTIFYMSMHIYWHEPKNFSYKMIKFYYNKFFVIWSDVKNRTETRKFKCNNVVFVVGNRKDV